MNWQALGISEAAGRIAMREPRVTDRLEMLSSLIELREGVWDVELYKSILARSKILAAKRDLLAHGIWGYCKTSKRVARSTGTRFVAEKSVRPHQGEQESHS
jgi:hypothetical protein